MNPVRFRICHRLLVASFIFLMAIGVPALLHADSTHESERDGEVANLTAPSQEHDHAGHATMGFDWEGSQEGIAYSERNHHVAGLFIILMGLAELSHALRLPSIAWARFLLPAAMTLTGIFLMVWSDHEAWPIGSLSFSDTFFGQDHEIVQHKVYGIMALAVGSVELFRRLGRVGHQAWATPLPLMAIVGGIMLFGHSHGVHPAAEKITLHHTVMGVLAITAGSSKLWDGWAQPVSPRASKLEFLWVGLLLLIGAQLLVYSE